MQALRKSEPAPGLTLVEDAPEPELGQRDVLVRVSLAGICGTDRHIYEWDEWAASRVPLGLVVGHELMGEVVALGPATTRVKIGDRVSIEGHIGCGSCQPCRTGHGHICEAVDIIGIDVDGGFAQLCAVPEDNAWVVAEEISDEVGALMDPLGNAVHTVTSAGVSGRSILITGAGVIGQLALRVARAAGAARIIVTDVARERREFALASGADVAIDASDPDWPDLVRGQTDGQGPEVLLEFSGDPSAIDGGLTALRNGGTAALLGLPSGPVSIDLPNQVIFKGATVLGINGRRMFETWFHVEGLLRSGRLDVADVVTHRLPFEEFDRAFALLADPSTLKVLLALGKGEADADRDP